ncbi:MAG: ATP-binding cassette domain-containing protein [Clostridiales bacterium]|uniref:ABC transporter ATP-binding protein n=1 Tax=Clostridium sp. N3C TaxID=1776758 RepID=UPI00092E087C|nr:ATP-binding cassette domain-containing protein [Clostridium sp. N3C]NLZ49448.1 ATP-binding cassette domain-containing protein [Clostridiales bacterium]SCN24927.1 Methionine import ATP-binding protein MetN [Clostridium sp. N3C]
MIRVNGISKEFISAKKYPGLKGAIKGLFTREKVRKVAVDNVSFHIKKGEIVGYIGSNGAGKSTTIKMMTGILKPTSGTCLVGGIDPSKERKANAQQIGVVFGQRTQLWWDLPLSESFVVLKEIYGVSDKHFEERMKFLNEVLGLEDFIHSTVRTLSLGQRMRADLAAALLHNPKVLYLDEPAIGLDVVVKDKIRQAIKDINQKYETTVVLTTHDLGDIEELCNRIIIIDNGKLIYDGTVEELRDKFGIKRTIEIEVKNVDKIKDINYNQYFNLREEDLTLDINGNNLNFSFNKNLIEVSKIISKVMSDTEVKDIKIKETDLAEIVKEIYVHGI